MAAKQVLASAPDGPPEGSFLSAATRAGDFIYVSGHAGLVPGSSAYGEARDWMPGEVVEGGIEAETRTTLENLRIVLEAAGGSLKDVVKINTYLRDIDRDFMAYNEIYKTYFPDNPPSRTTVGATIYGKLLIEIDCVAYVPLERA
jgi:enamine deaminase RidA (YjgF/YER057c/UK114 family)